MLQLSDRALQEGRSLCELVDQGDQTKTDQHLTISSAIQGLEGRGGRFRSRRGRKMGESRIWGGIRVLGGEEELCMVAKTKLWSFFGEGATCR